MQKRRRGEQRLLPPPNPCPSKCREQAFSLEPFAFGSLPLLGPKALPSPPLPLLAVDLHIPPHPARKEASQDTRERPHDEESPEQGSVRSSGAPWVPASRDVLPDVTNLSPSTSKSRLPLSRICTADLPYNLEICSVASCWLPEEKSWGCRKPCLPGAATNLVFLGLPQAPRETHCRGRM